MSPAKKPRRVAIVDGLRTPFAKSSTVFRNLSTLDLSSAVVAELVARSGVDASAVDRVVYGAVVADVGAPNIAREIVLAGPFPESVDAYSVSRACATSTQSFVEGAQSILLGETDIVITGGADSLSKPPITYSDRFVEILMEANAARDMPSKVKAFAKVRPKDLVPNPPAIAERSTGKTMGHSAEEMAKANGISREQQDEFTVRSHAKAIEAWETGVFDDEVMPLHVPPRFEEAVERDTIPRSDSTLEKLATLKPVFDRKYGTVTAANASPLTDGASALLLMDESVAKALGYEPKAYLKSYAFAALDPNWQLLMGPAFATPLALDRAGMTLDDIDLIDMHEAFAAQVLSNVQAFASDEFAQKRLGRKKAIGEIDDSKFNIYGGSISIGHPFAATGARQIMTMANELDRRGGGTALVTQCAAGGLGAAVVLER
ncbi:MAG: acetyl-CoA C-acyltransferase FadI [Actinomycetota bacterium]|nr:acetyl-CoA C-acyltransferase FadI [Actinomycetota bacterium]MDK1017690.1 acetyl-CoA C-acyltransferase FadI [Actinomycetota bacterium]MDK1026074.1 acetyl-CoA C-acyltransferase FadI [Actinomycetota bacterium]MDK1038430.1 acetyl-CoA C-acyltransferase FadI [Actinomycetota bacterium]MDK1096760.1 acetyl-CoA C-acyltransferase FadI [Actinomycetota bacterium]